MIKLEIKPKLNIGIDIGATRIVVACYDDEDERPIVVTDPQNKRITPTCLAFVDHQILLGSVADNHATAFPEAVISGRDIKLVLGEQELPQINPIYFPHKMIHHENVGIAFEVEYNGTSIQIIPEQVISMLLKFLKENIVKQYLDYEIGKCVITVPSVYDDAKASALINACVAAGFDQNEVDIITSSMAAALTYFMERYKCTEHKHVMVFDMGATTLDYTVVSIKESELNVELSGGELNLGGDQFTMHLVEYFLKEFNEIDRKNIEQDKQAMTRLRRECDKIKEKLFLCNDAKSSLGAFHNRQDFDMHITKNQFEQICENLIDQISVKLNAIALEFGKIDEYIINGDGARISIIQEKFETVFKDSQFQRFLSKVDTAAIGAAYYARKLGLQNKIRKDKLSDLNISHKKCIQRTITTNQDIINCILQEIDQIKTTETKFQDKAKALNDLQNFCDKINKELNNSKIRNVKKNEITVECERILTWIKNKDTKSVEELRKEHETLKSLYEKINELDQTDKKTKLSITKDESSFKKDLDSDLKENVKSKLDSNVKKVKANTKLENQRKQLTDIENLIKDLDYNEALKELTSMIRSLNEDLDDENMISSIHRKRAEVQKLIGSNNAALSDYNHLLESDRLSSNQKETIKMEPDQIENNLITNKVIETMNQCKQTALQGIQMAPVIDKKIDELLSKLIEDKYTNIKGEIYYEHAKIHFHFKNYKKSIRLAKMAIENNSDKGESYDMLGQCYFNLGDFENAITNFELAHKMNPTKESRNKKENCKLEIRSNEITAKLIKIETLWKQKEYKESLKILEEINLTNITDNCLMFEVFYKRAFTLYSCQKYEEALIQCNEAKTLRRKMSSEDTSKLDTNKFDVVEKIRNEIKKILFERKMIETIERCEEHAKFGNSRALDINKEFENLISQLNKDLKDFTGKIYFEHAKIHYRLKNYQKTITLANLAIQNYSKKDILYDMIGKCYFYLGYYEKAKANFEAAYKLNSSYNGLKDKIEQCVIEIKTNVVKDKLKTCDDLYEQKQFVESLNLLRDIDLRNIKDDYLMFEFLYRKTLALFGCHKSNEALIQFNKLLDLKKNLKLDDNEKLKLGKKINEINKELAKTNMFEILKRCTVIAQGGSQKSTEIDRYFKNLISELDVNVLKEYKAYIYYQYAKIYFDFENYLKSIELANMGNQNQKGDDILFNIIGDCYFKIGDFENAKLNYEAAYSLNSTEELQSKIERITKERDRKILVKDKLGSFEVEWQQGEYEKSLEILETIDLNQITDILLKFVVLQRKTLSLLSCQRYVEALNICNAALQLKIKKTMAKTKKSQLNSEYDTVQMKTSLYFMTGKCYFHLEDFEKAKTALQKAQKRENSAETNKFLQKCNQKLYLQEVNKQLEASNRFFNEKNYKQALKELQNVDLNRIPEFNLKIKVLYEKARSYYRLEKEKDALIQCEEAIKMYNADHNKYPDLNSYEAIQIQLIRSKLHSIAGKCYFKQKSHKQGFVDFEMARNILEFLDQHLETVETRLNIFEKFFEESKYDFALKILINIDVEQIVVNDLKHKVIISLAKANLKLGKEEEACQYCGKLPTGVFENEVNLIFGKTELKVGTLVSKFKTLQLD